jgi:hypothetical protein
VGQNLPCRDFCGTAALPLETGHWLARLARPKSANCGLMHRSKRGTTNGLLDRVPSSCVVERENTVRRVPKVLGGTSRHGFQNDIA